MQLLCRVPQTAADVGCLGLILLYMFRVQQSLLKRPHSQPFTLWAGPAAAVLASPSLPRMMIRWLSDDDLACMGLTVLMLPQQNAILDVLLQRNNMGPSFP